MTIVEVLNKWSVNFYKSRCEFKDSPAINAEKTPQNSHKLNQIMDWENCETPTVNAGLQRLLPLSVHKLLRLVSSGTAFCTHKLCLIIKRKYCRYFTSFHIQLSFLLGASHVFFVLIPILQYVVADFSGKVVMSTCGVIRGEVTSAACLIRWHHPHTRTGGPAAVPASLQEDTTLVNHLISHTYFLTYGYMICRPWHFCSTTVRDAWYGLFSDNTNNRWLPAFHGRYR